MSLGIPNIIIRDRTSLDIYLVNRLKSTKTPYFSTNIDETTLSITSLLVI